LRPSKPLISGLFGDSWVPIFGSIFSHTKIFTVFDKKVKNELKILKSEKVE